jgi:hypothetical protein
MKKVFFFFKTAFTVLLLFTAFNGCVKDTCNHTYTLYEPVYKTNAEVRANIKSNMPLPIKNPGKLFVLSSYIFLNEVDKGIHVIDNSNPSSPVNKYFIDIPGNVDLAVKGNTLYADLYTDMVTMDITNPASIQVKSIINNAFPFRRYSNGFFADTSRIIVDWIKKDTTVKSDCGGSLWGWGGRRDILMLSSSGGVQSSAAFASATGVAGSMARFALLNNYLYTVTDNALNVFNITQLQQPAFTNKVNLGFGIETIYPFKNNLFIGSNTGMLIYGTSNPMQPNKVSTFNHARACDPVIADDNFAYVTLRSGTACRNLDNQLDVVNIQNLSTPTLVKTYPLTNPHGLSKDGNTLFICDGAAGLKVFDASVASNVKILQTIGGIDTYDVITINGVAIVSAKDGLYQYDYTNRTNLKLLSKTGYTK